MMTHMDEVKQLRQENQLLRSENDTLNQQNVILTQEKEALIQEIAHLKSISIISIPTPLANASFSLKQKINQTNLDRPLPSFPDSTRDEEVKRSSQLKEFNKLTPQKVGVHFRTEAKTSYSNSQCLSANSDTLKSTEESKTEIKEFLKESKQLLEPGIFKQFIASIKQLTNKKEDTTDVLFKISNLLGEKNLEIYNKLVYLLSYKPYSL